MDFNINHKVRVKLTDFGRQTLERQHVKFWADAAPGKHHPFEPRKEDAEGWSEWQLWCLMKDLGSYCINGGRLPFETGIQIVESAPQAPAAPLDMVLHCPACHRQHIDAPETDEQYNGRLFESSWWECGGDKPERWTNPVHRSHKCSHCNFIWRPADVPTNGVAAVKTKGKADSPIAHPPARSVAAAETEAWLIRMSNGKRFIYPHNAIGDYRAIDPGATVVELVPRDRSEAGSTEGGAA